MIDDRTRHNLRPDHATPELPSDRPAPAHRPSTLTIATVTLASATPAHGCWEEISPEEYERWDGLS